MSTKTDRLKPRLIVYTGEGKGKTTAAFGMGLRAWAQGWRIGIFQFIKSTKWRIGERAAFDQLNLAHTSSKVGGSVDWFTLGEGFTWLNHGANDRELAKAGWQQVKRALEKQSYDFYLLDEFNHVLHRGWVDLTEVIETLNARPGHQHVVITGRNAPAELIAAADLVTYMKNVKHPFDKGERGQAGIEW